MHVFIMSDMIIIIKFINITFGLLEVVMCVFSALCMRFAWMVNLAAIYFLYAMPRMKRFNFINSRVGQKVKGKLH
ncbi:hypothetical protein Hanom_Chr12g01100141 [Helianthus anomalus]